MNKIGWQGVRGFSLSQDRDRWRNLANAAINFWAP